MNLWPEDGDSPSSEEVLPKGGHPPYVQVLMLLVCPDDGAKWWEVESIYEFRGEMCATLRSCDARRLEQVPCSDIRSKWILYEDFDPAKGAE